MAEYFLPDADIVKPLPCAYEVRLLTPSDFAGYYLPQWSNALCEKRRQLDMLAVGAYSGGECIGLAGASADCDSMWQIGIDVLPPYRRQGVASALTSTLAAKNFRAWQGSVLLLRMVQYKIGKKRDPQRLSARMGANHGA